MYLAGKELSPDHDYNKLLSEMREGKSRQYPQFAVKKKIEDNIPDYGLAHSAQTVAAYNEAVSLLENSDIKDSSAAQHVIRSLKNRTHDLRGRAQTDLDNIAKWSEWASLSEDKRAQINAFKDQLDTALHQEKDPETVNALTNARQQLSRAGLDPQAVWSKNDADKAAEATKNLS